MKEQRSKKKSKLTTSHRYNLLPLLPSGPGGIQRELVVYDFPRCKYSLFMSLCQVSRKIYQVFREFVPCRRWLTSSR